jgi:hypothetical protein
VEPPSLPRFEATQRRDFLKRAAVLGALAVVPGLASACSKDDEDAFADAPTASTSATTSAGGASTTADAGGDRSTTTAAGTGDALPDGAALEVAFTWGASGGGRNPFVAVWVESAAGDLIANLAVWYDPPKGNRWIDNLASWYTAVSETSSDYLTTTTSATRAAGSYTLSWDGTDADGARAAQGDYVVFIEAAQEHGAHSLTSAPIALGAADAEATLPDDGDLSAATATYRA